MDVNFEYYRIFYYVAKYRNFTKAAHALHNSQPNITRAMNCLEREIHCTLFIRTNRGVRLTEEGEKLFRHVSAAMMQILAAEEELTESAELEKGCVEDYRAGKKKAIGFLVGQTMKATQGKADPGMVNQILTELLQG